MVLSMDLFRADKGGDPDRIKKSQKDRYKDPNVVDKIIDLDEQWRKGVLCGLFYCIQLALLVTISIAQKIYVVKLSGRK